MNFYSKRCCSLKTKLTIFIFVVFLVSIWSLPFYAGRLLHEDMKRLAGEQQFSTVSFMAAEINEELETRLQSLEKVASQITPPMLDHPASLQALLEQRPLLRILFNSGVFATGIDGTAIADIPLSAGRIGVNYLDRDPISRTIKEGKSVVGRPAMGKKLAAPIFSLAAPIRDARGKVIGVLAGTINLNLSSFLDKLTNNHYGKSGGYLLVAPQYRLVVTATNKRRIMSPASPPGANKLIDRFMQGYEGTGITVNALGVEVLAAVKHVPVAGWYVAATLPTTEAFAPIHTMQRHLWLAALLLTLIASGLTRLMLKRLLSPMLATAATIGAMTDTGLPPRPLAIVRDDEIGQLIGGFNRLLKTLAQREEKLVQSEEKRRSILQSALEGFYILDHEGRFLEVNAAICRMSGYTEQELLAMRITELEAIETADETAARLGKIMAQGNEDFETRLRRKDGSVFEAEVSVLHQHIDGGRFTVFIHDISERKKTEDALRESETRFSTVFRNSPIAIGLSRMDNNCFVDVNDSFLSIFGYSREEVLGTTSLELGLWPFLEERDKMIRQLQAQGRVQQYEAKFRHKSGKIGYLLISAEIIELRGQHYLMGMLSDISERKQIEEALVNSEERYRRLFEVESDALLMVDHESGRFRDANTAALKMYGYTIEEILHLKHTDISAEPDRTRQAMGKHLSTVPIRWHRKKDGTIFPVEIAGSYFTYKDSNVHVAAIRDITKRVQQEDELRQALEAAQMASGTMSRLLRTVAHEFRTPLGLLTGSTDILDRYWDRLTPEKRFEQNKQIRSATRQISILLDSVLSFNQLKTDKSANSPQLTDIDETSRSIAAEVETVWSTGQKFTVTTASNCGSALLDMVHFRRILENLLTNAFRYTPPDGSISLHVRREKNRLRLEIIDTGIGIPEGDQTQIFDAFYRSQNVEERRGLGLGLSIVRESLSQLDGTITVISKPGKGTTMRVGIPVDPV
jgi:PAS domain S-box-containing protein